MLALPDASGIEISPVFDITGIGGSKESESFRPPVFEGSSKLTVFDNEGMGRSMVVDPPGPTGGNKVSVGLGPKVFVRVGSKLPVSDTPGPIGGSEPEVFESIVFVGSGSRLAVFDVRDAEGISVSDPTGPTGGRRESEGFEPPVFVGSGSWVSEVFAPTVSVGPERPPDLDPVGSTGGRKDLETLEPSYIDDAITGELGVSGIFEMLPVFDGNCGVIGMIVSDCSTSEGPTGSFAVGVTRLGDVVMVSLPEGLIVLDESCGRPSVSESDGAEDKVAPVGIDFDRLGAEFVAPDTAAELDTPIPPNPVGFSVGFVISVSSLGAPLLVGF